MRSLEEWTRYLEQQEQMLREASAPAAPREVDEESGQSSGTVASPKADRSAERPGGDGGGGRAAAVRADAELPGSRGRTADADDRRVGVPSLGATVRVRKRLSEHLKMLGDKQEVAQGSYKGFKETREELLMRLLDPTLTLEEVARILNVCPTTVRRYANRGLLKHIRTAGNQRRFRLSDVIAFLEVQVPGRGASDEQ